MVITLGDSHQLQFYRSSDLLHWGDGPISTFGPDGDVSAAWETPNLFRLPVEGDAGRSQWVLTVAVSPNCMRYFIGRFDGTSFTNLYPGMSFTLDAGPDFYAARTWREFDGSQTNTPLLGWMGNWQYSRHAPSQDSYGGEGVMSVPRNLALRTYPEGLRLVQTPIPGLKQLRQREAQAANIMISGTHPVTDFVSFIPRGNAYEIDATFDVPEAALFGFHLLADGGHLHQLTVKYDPAHSTLSVDRSTSSDAMLNAYFTAPIPPVRVETVNGQLRLHMFIDRSSIEIFTNDGKVVFTALTYPGPNQLGIDVFSTGGPTTLATFSAWQLSSIWDGSPPARVQSGSTYELQSRANQETMATSGSGERGKLQRWKIDLVEQGSWESFDRWMPPSYRLTDKENGRVLEGRYDSVADRSILEESDWANSDNQKWQITGVGGGFYKIVPKSSIVNGGREALEMMVGCSSGPGRTGCPRLQLGNFFAYHDQEWSLLPVP